MSPRHFSKIWSGNRLSQSQREREMEEKIDKIDTKLTQVVDAILGNPLTKQGGFMHEMDILKLKIEELENKQRSYENFKNKISWTVGLIIAAAFVLASCQEQISDKAILPNQANHLPFCPRSGKWRRFNLPVCQQR